jgi:hypothetical protein
LRILQGYISERKKGKSPNVVVGSPREELFDKVVVHVSYDERQRNRHNQMQVAADMTADMKRVAALPVKLHAINLGVRSSLNSHPSFYYPHIVQVQAVTFPCYPF